MILRTCIIQYSVADMLGTVLNYTLKKTYADVYNVLNNEQLQVQLMLYLAAERLTHLPPYTCKWYNTFWNIVAVDYSSVMKIGEEGSNIFIHACLNFPPPKINHKMYIFSGNGKKRNYCRFKPVFGYNTDTCLLIICPDSLLSFFKIAQFWPVFPRSVYHMVCRTDKRNKML